MHQPVCLRCVCLQLRPTDLKTGQKFQLFLLFPFQSLCLFLSTPHVMLGIDLDPSWFWVIQPWDKCNFFFLSSWSIFNLCEGIFTFTCPRRISWLFTSAHGFALTLHAIALHLKFTFYQLTEYHPLYPVVQQQHLRCNKMCSKISM